MTSKANRRQSKNVGSDGGLRLRTRWVALLLAAIALLAYANSFEAELAQDARGRILNDPRVHEISAANLRQIVAQDYWWPIHPSGLYRPLTTLSYLFNYSGRPWLTQKWVREIMDKYYGTGPVNGYPGDEDQGQMGAWYVMSAIGLFEMRGGAAAKPVYEIGSPIFKRATIHLDDRYYPGGTFVIEAKNNSRENRYIQSATLDGKPLNQPWFYHHQLTDGGALVLEMGPKPNKKWGSGPEAAPPSMTK